MTDLPGFRVYIDAGVYGLARGRRVRTRARDILRTLVRVSVSVRERQVAIMKSEIQRASAYAEVIYVFAVPRRVHVRTRNNIRSAIFPTARFSASLGNYAVAALLATFACDESVSRFVDNATRCVL